MDTSEQYEDLNLDELLAQDNDAPPADDTGGSGSQKIFARTKIRATGFANRMEGRREDSRLIDAGFMVLARDQQFPTSLLAGALVSRIVIYMIPFLLFLIFALGLFSEVVAASPEEAARQAGIAGLFAQVAGDSADAPAEWRVATMLITLFAVLWAADGMARNLRRVHAVVWRVRLRHRRFRWALPLAVVGFSLAALASSSITAGMGGRSFWLALAFAVEFLLIGLMWAGASMALPHDPSATHWRDFLPGALVMAIVVIAGKIATVFYFAPRSASYTDRYGGLGIVLILLSWAYLMSYAIVASADVNAATFRTSRDPVDADHPPGGA